MEYAAYVALAVVLLLIVYGMSNWLHQRWPHGRLLALALLALAFVPQLQALVITVITAWILLTLFYLAIDSDPF